MMVSLPAKWVRKLKIQKGEDLEVKETDQGLLVSPLDMADQQIRKIQVDASDYKKDLQRFLSAIFQNGYDEIGIKYEDPDAIRKLVTEQFVGLEVVNYKKEFVELKSVSKGTKEEFDRLLRRTFLINKQMISELHNVLYEKDFESIKLVRQMEKTNNRFTNYCRRIIIKSRSMQDKKTPFLFSFVSELEKIADNIQYLANNMENFKPQLNKDFKQTIEEIEKLSGFVMNQYYKFNIQEMFEMYNQSRQLIKDLIKKQKSYNKNDILVCMYLIIIIQNISNLFGYILYYKISELE